ncbi:MAG: hypothetical protein R1F54_08680 [Candidatus Zeuxoniibacter abyssi]|nr:MAG: hypothetical protein R1F54_08680 [Candidatus Persebacteraceae bacterium AB1(2)]
MVFRFGEKSNDKNDKIIGGVGGAFEHGGGVVWGYFPLRWKFFGN